MVVEWVCGTARLECKGGEEFCVPVLGLVLVNSFKVKIWRDGEERMY